MVQLNGPFGPNDGPFEHSGFYVAAKRNYLIYATFLVDIAIIFQNMVSALNVSLLYIKKLNLYQFGKKLVTFFYMDQK